MTPFVSRVARAENPPDVVAESTKTIYAALSANGLIALAKAVGGVISGSSALLAEAAHSVADTTNRVLLLVSLSLGRKRPDEEHPFGHGKERLPGDQRPP